MDAPGLILGLGSLALALTLGGLGLALFRQGRARRGLEASLAVATERLGHLEEALEACGDRAWVLYPDQERGTIYFGRSAQTRPGEESLLLETALERVHPEDMAAARQILRAHSQTPDAICEVEYRRASLTGDGTWVWMELRGRALARHPDGRAIRMAGVIRDITRRKEAEETLKASERLYRTIVEDQTDLICRATPEGVLTFVNEAYALAFDRSPAELMGVNFFDLVPEADRPDLCRHLDGISLDQQTSAVEHRVNLPGGGVGWQRWVDRGIFDARGRLKEYQSVGRDVTKRKEAELALAQSEDKYRRVFETTADAMILMDYETRRILDANSAACRLYGYQRDELVGLDMMILSAEPARTLASINAAESHVPLRYHVRKDGAIFPVEISMNRSRRNGRHLGVCLMRDISGRIEAERGKDEFLATVAHELKTPLTSLYGSLGLLQANVEKMPRDKLLSLLTIAHGNSRRLIRLVGDILDNEKLQSGKLVFHRTLVRLGPVLQRATEEMRFYAQTREVGLTLDLPLGDVQVWADPDRVEQVLINLLSNAIKHAPGGSEVGIGLEAAAGLARISVRDQGPGIPAEFQGQIFERFVQIGISGTSSRGGSGLGLTIAKALVERMGGRMDFESQDGRGAEFWFELPLAGSEAAHER